MTYSIVATDPVSGAMGAATATGLAAVGGFVTHTRFGAGAIATQGLFTNWISGEKGLALLMQGHDANKVMEILVNEDNGSSQRQFIVCDTLGNTAGHTGHANKDFKIHVCRQDYAIAGNMLAGKDIIEAMEAAFLGDESQELHLRLINSLMVGEKAGGDYRGTHSCAVKVSYFDRPPFDLRVDWADYNCCQQLLSIYEKTQCTSFQEFIAWVPTIAEPDKKKVMLEPAMPLAATLVAPDIIANDKENI